MKCKICGMEINEGNYNFNELAFTNKNSKDDIIYCPFCGVSHKYLSEDDEIITVENNLLSNNALKIIDHAVKLELFNSEFYNIAANMTENYKLRETFKALARIELLHSRIHQKLGRIKQVPNLSKINYDRYSTDAALLKLAKQKEEHAVSYYEKYKKEVNDKKLLEIFEALAEVERGHIILVEE